MRTRSASVGWASILAILGCWTTSGGLPAIAQVKPGGSLVLPVPEQPFGGKTVAEGRIEQTAAEGRIEQTAPVRFSLDESFDVGEDAGTPVIDEYEAKMPARFTGSLKKVEFKLGLDKLTIEENGELARRRREIALIAH